MAEFPKGVRACLSGPDVHLRLARMEDLERIVQVCARSFPGSFRWVDGTEPPRRWWRVALETESSETWVAEETETGIVVGVMLLVLNEHRWRALDPVRQISRVEWLTAVLRAPERLRARWRKAPQSVAPAVRDLRQAKRYDPVDRIFLELIATLPEAQGRGIGQRMLGLAFERVCALNRSALACVVDPRNPAIEFYQKLGFGITGQSNHGINLSVSVASASIRS